MCAFKIRGPGKYRTRDGREYTLQRNCVPVLTEQGFTWMDQHGFSYRDDGSFKMSKEEAGRDIVAKVRAPKRKHRPSNPTKRRKTPVNTPKNKYFIGKLDKAIRGSVYRIFRRRKTKLLLTVDEMWTRSGWKKMKKGYFKVSHLLYSQAAAREEQQWYRKHA